MYCLSMRFAIGQVDMVQAKGILISAETYSTLYSRGQLLGQPRKVLDDALSHGHGYQYCLCNDNVHVSNIVRKNSRYTCSLRL